MKTKIIGIISCLMLMITVFPISIICGSVPKIIYVDDDGGVDYTKIQDAIDAASNGDTIYVYNGIYYENLEIDVSITLTGEEKVNTIIDGNNNGNVIDVAADSVVINGFTVRNSEIYESGIFAYNTRDLSVSDCIITFNDGIGIELDETKSSLVSNCIISSNDLFGVLIYSSNGHVPASNHNVVTNSIISENDIGVFLDDTTSNSIIRNQITNNHIYGVYLSYAEGNEINENNLMDNNENAYFIGIFRNYWSNNYWSDPSITKVKIIKGRFFTFPWLNFDLNPAIKPFNIEVV